MIAVHRGAADSMHMQSTERLERGVGLRTAVLLNMLDMVGVGPFITLPLIVTAMGGPQAMLGWILGGLFAMCDGLVWAELAASMPMAGGSYNFLKQIYGPNGLGRLVSFLFIWQLTFSAPLSVASGAIGLAHYGSYFFPQLNRNIASWSPLPHLQLSVSIGTFVAIAMVLLAVLLAYRRIAAISRLSTVLSAGVLLALAVVIFTGLTHFDAKLAFSFPPDAFRLGRPFFAGLGAAMLVATYDYWGYYNVAYLGGEVKDPERNIPHAIIISIALITVIYVLMNISVLGVVPWQTLTSAAHSESRFFVMSSMLEQVYGRWAGGAVTVLIVWTAFSSIFSLLLGYSRVPYAAAVDHNYFEPFARLHPRHHIPHVSLLVLGAVAVLCCFLSLADVIAALVVIRILLQFLLQSVGLILMRAVHPEMRRPFRMWLYPLPAIVAALGFIYIVLVRPNFLKEIRYAAVLLFAGVLLYLVRAVRRREWPFAAAVESGPTAKDV